MSNPYRHRHLGKLSGVDERGEELIGEPFLGETDRGDTVAMPELV